MWFAYADSCTLTVHDTADFYLLNICAPIHEVIISNCNS